MLLGNHHSAGLVGSVQLSSLFIGMLFHLIFCSSLFSLGIVSPLPHCCCCGFYLGSKIIFRALKDFQRETPYHAISTIRLHNGPYVTSYLWKPKRSPYPFSHDPFKCTSYSHSAFNFNSLLLDTPFSSFISMVTNPKIGPVRCWWRSRCPVALL